MGEREWGLAPKQNLERGQRWNTRRRFSDATFTFAVSPLSRPINSREQLRGQARVTDRKRGSAPKISVDFKVGVSLTPNSPLYTQGSSHVWM